MLRKLFSKDESDGRRAVSPVIGVILMVAITVILAAVIATFVLGLGETVSDTAPNANFQGENPDTIELNASETSTPHVGETAIEFQHTNGPTIDVNTLNISGLNAADIADELNSSLSLSNDAAFNASLEVIGPADGEIGASETIALQIKVGQNNNLGIDDDAGNEATILEGEEVTLVWENEGTSATLRQFTLEDGITVSIIE